MDRPMTVIEHLEELRRRLIISLASVLVCALLSYAACPKILEFISRPAGRLVFLAPYEAFFTYIKLAVFCGVFLASPVVIYQVWRFISTGLRPDERRYIVFFMPLGLILFFTGAGFALFVVVPYGIRFLLSFATDSVVPMLSVGRYVSTVGWLLLIFGTGFQLPIVIILLTKLKIVTPRTLKRNRKYALLAIFIIAAMVTPGPDIFSQVALAVPLVFLYEFGIFLSKLVR